ncbi:MAG: homocysteine biosynthesis protein [Candidatus Desulfofervidus auxilii]|nr:homocysteine biosynthesis protein [Candidatus Desulfofervidus auxilii]
MKTIEEINAKIKKGKVVVVTAEEIIEVVKEKGVKKTLQEVDVVTTGTFSPMCSSGILLNLKSSVSLMKLGGGEVYLNSVPAYCGLAAADIYLGATALPEDDPRNKVYPGEFKYGGGHVIEELVAGKDIKIEAYAYGTHCYPRTEYTGFINIHSLNNAFLLNPRNVYQNYNVAVNLSHKVFYTYMGVLLPRLGNANYATAGQLSPLFNDPYGKTIGIGTRIFLGGGIGYVIWYGTQHRSKVPRTNKGIPTRPAGTLALIGNLKQMNSYWLRGVSLKGYGVSLAVGVGIPIPLLDEEILYYTLVTNEDIHMPVVDYGEAYPQGKEEVLEEVTYAELQSGEVEIGGKKVPTGSLSSYARAREVAEILKRWIKEGRFTLTQPSVSLEELGVSYG